MHILPVKLLHPDATAPTLGAKDSAGYDLYACQPATIAPGQRVAVRIGIALAIAPGYYGRVAPRSGLAVRHGIDVLAGVIDPGYTGEVMAVLINHGAITVEFEAGVRVAQLIIEQVATPSVVVVDELPTTARGEAGFGSTGA